MVRIVRSDTTTDYCHSTLELTEDPRDLLVRYYRWPVMVNTVAFNVTFRHRVHEVSPPRRQRYRLSHGILMSRATPRTTNDGLVATAK